MHNTNITDRYKYLEEIQKNKANLLSCQKILE